MPDRRTQSPLASWIPWVVGSLGAALVVIALARPYLAMHIAVGSSAGLALSGALIGVAIHQRRRATARAGLLRDALRSSPAIIWMLDEHGRFLLSEGAGLRALDLRPGEVVGQSVFDLYANNAPTIELSRQALRGEPAHGFAHVGGVDYDVGYTPLFNDIGHVRAVVGVATDISEMLRAERRQQVLNRELRHRVKNSLAVVVALVDRAAARASDEESMRRELVTLLQAMSRTQDVVSEQSMEATALCDVMRASLEDFLLDGESIELEGPDVHVDARQANGLTIIARELVTNAAKHGALGAPDGRVRVSWRIAGDRVAIEWREIRSAGSALDVTPPGAPVIDPESRRADGEGEGLRLIGQVTRHDLRGEFSRRFERTGFVGEIAFPLAQTPEPALPA